MPTWVSTLIVSAAIAFVPAGTEAATVSVGVDPTVYDLVSEGVEGWNATGYVEFVVEPTGCGTGDVTVCVVWWEPGWHLACNGCSPGMPRIDLDGYDLAAIEPATICHELGHYLGLSYHRSDNLSCMTNPAGTVNAPDAQDIEALGWGVVSLPNTGTGSTDEGKYHAY